MPSRALLCVLSLLLACSSEDPPNDAVADCQRLAALACARIVDCLIEAGTVAAADRSEAEDACNGEGVMLLNCDRATRRGESYDACNAEVESLDCDELDASTLDEGLPAECEGAIIVD